MPMIVNSEAALASALKTVKAGDTILVAPGSYNVTMVNLNLGGVTITSAEAGKPAIFTSLFMKASSGVNFQDLEFNVTAKGGETPFKVQNSQDVTFNQINVHGSLDGNPGNDLGAFMIRGSSQVVIENSEFQQLSMGVSHLDDNNLTIRGNYFHDMRLDGVRGGGSSNVTIADNTFQNFYPATGDHADAIQFWTTNTTTSAQNIVVTDNVIQRGSGGLIQGLFIRDEVGGIPFKNVTISGNLVSGGNYNGIAVLGGANITIADNIVIGFLDNKSWIRVEQSSGVVVEGNAANTYLLTTAVTGLTNTGNSTAAQAADSGAGAYILWSGQHGADDVGAGLALVGGNGIDALTGGAGDDTLNGVAGIDILIGGEGDDLYITDGNAKIVETAPGGIDTMRSFGSATLPSNVENGELVGIKGWAGGNALDNRLTGSAGANKLSGMGGADTLDGAAGSDTIVGGVGADVLSGGVGADVFVFARGDGADVIKDFGLGGEADAIDASAITASGGKATLVDLSAGVEIRFSTGETFLVEGVHASGLHATATGWIF